MGENVHLSPVDRVESRRRPTGGVISLLKRSKRAFGQISAAVGEVSATYAGGEVGERSTASGRWVQIPT